MEIKTVPLVNQSYWNELAGKENPTLEDFINLMRGMEDQATVTEREDAIALAESVKDSMKLSESIDKNLDDCVKEAEDVIMQLDEILQDNTGASIVKVYNEALRITQDETLPEVVKKPMRDLLNTIQGNKELKDFVEGKGQAILFAQNFAKDHPIRLKVENIKSDIKNVVHKINDARTFIKNESQNLLTSFKTASTAFTINMTDSLSSVKVSVAETANRNLEKIAKSYNNAVCDFQKFAERAIKKLSELTLKATVFKDKLLDMITMGLHSKIHQTHDLSFYERALNRNTDKLNNLYDSYKAGAKEDLDIERKLKKNIKENEKQVKRLKKLETKRGMSNNDYWKNITDTAFLWGVLEDNGRQTGYLKSPVQAIIDSRSKVNDHLRNAVNNVNKLTDKTVKRIEKEVDGLKLDCRNFKREISLDLTNFVADLYHNKASHYHERIKRLNNKITQLSVIDKQLSVQKNEMQKILHDLTEVTPYKETEFIPNPQILAQIEVLKNMNPQENAEIHLAIKHLEKCIKNERKDYDKEVNESKTLYNSQVSNAQQELNDVEKYISLNLKELNETQQELEKMTNAYEKMTVKEATQNEKAIEILDEMEYTE